MNDEQTEPTEPNPAPSGTRSGSDRSRKPRKQRSRPATDSRPPKDRPADELAHPVERPREPANILNLDPTSPFRPPDYRWQLAERLVAGRFTPPEWVDDWVRLAVRALGVESELHTDDPDMRAVLGAREFAIRAGYWPRVELEGRLLAAEPEPTIAAKCGLPEPLVRAYEALWYAVADRLKHSSYVMHLVVRLHAPEHERDRGTHVRMMAYQGGPLVLDTLLEALAGIRTGPPGDPETLRLARLNIGLRITPADARHALRWAHLHALFRACKWAGVLRS